MTQHGAFQQFKHWLAGQLGALAVPVVSSEAITAASLKATGLTATRVPVVGTGGLLTDDAGMTYVVATDTLTVGALSVTADVAAAGGFRQQIGPSFDTLAATQTDTKLKYGGASVALGWIAQRAGSIVALSVHIDAAITGAGTTVAFDVYKNGTKQAGFTVTLTQAGAEVKGQATVAKDTRTFVAGDIITVGYTSTGISNTPVAVASVEVEQ